MQQLTQDKMTTIKKPKTIEKLNVALQKNIHLLKTNLTQAKEISELRQEIYALNMTINIYREEIDRLEMAVEVNKDYIVTNEEQYNDTDSAIKEITDNLGEVHIDSDTEKQYEFSEDIAADEKSMYINDWESYDSQDNPYNDFDSDD